MNWHGWLKYLQTRLDIDEFIIDNRVFNPQLVCVLWPLCDYVVCIVWLFVCECAGRHMKLVLSLWSLIRTGLWSAGAGARGADFPTSDQEGMSYKIIIQQTDFRYLTFTNRIDALSCKNKLNIHEIFNYISCSKWTNLFISLLFVKDQIKTWSWIFPKPNPELGCWPFLLTKYRVRFLDLP